MRKIYFEKLTPTQDVDLKIYSEALDYVFENNDIVNVAISGAYSSGKSSIIESYKKEHGEYSFLHILLAYFETSTNTKQDTDKDSNDKKTDENSGIKESVLEGKILNQLLHQIDPSEIPQTNFRVKEDISDNSIKKTTIIIMFFIIWFLHILFIDDWKLLITELSKMKYFAFLSLIIFEVSVLLSWIVLIGIVGYVIFNIVKLQKNKRILKRFSVQGNEIEIFEKNDESYFDKYLNEVLYLFDHSNVDVIVFEDMDRYNVNQIFQRLREVNTLINSKRAKKNKKPLRFFYLLRDDIFVSKDRTKFFDFILPVVPVIDSSNSYNKFIEYFKKGKVFEKFDNQFLQRIAFYVDDMRILKNIYNEFMIYYNQIGTTDQDHNKLLAMIVYKNIFPRDFAETQLNKGFVSTLFNSRENIINNEVDNINKRINELEEKISECNKEHLENVKELGMIYYKTSYHGGRIADTSHTEYIRRKEILDLIENDQISEFKKEVSQLESEKLEIRNKKVHQLISRKNEKEVFSVSHIDFLGKEKSYKEVKSSDYFDLIKYLIWEGYIDETYEDYMTYFYSDSLTINDKKFIRSVLDKKAKEWDYKIDNPKLVISMLREVDFREIETLNFYLLDYLCVETEESENKLLKLINQLKDDKCYKFIQIYLQQSNNATPAIKKINHYWSEFLYEIIHTKKFSNQEIKEIILTTLYYSSREDIDMINQDEFLTNYISNDSEFLNIDNPKTEKLIKEFIHLKIEFKKINYPEVHNGLFNAVYQNNLYDFSYGNIVLMLSSIYDFQDTYEIKHRNYSLVMKNATSELSEYVMCEIDLYMTLYLDNCDNKISDDINDALDLINNEKINLSKREKYIEYLTTDLKDIQSINDESLWPLLLQKEIVDYNEKNIFQYYFNSGRGLDDILISFINSNENYQLDFSVKDIDSEFGDEKSEEFFTELVVCNDINNQRYQELIGRMGYVFSDFSFTDISEEKIKILIFLKTIKMNVNNLEYMRNNYELIVIDFIEYNIEEYIEEMIDSSPLIEEEILELLNKNIKDEFKIILLNQTARPISIFNDNYSDVVVEYIIRHNFEIRDFEQLMDNYHRFNESIRLAVFDLCKKNIEDVIHSERDLAPDLFMLLISQDGIDNEYKIGLLSNVVGHISKEDFKQYIEVIGHEEYLKIFTNKSRLPKVEINGYNKRLLDKLKEKRWIFNYVEENDMYKIQRVTKAHKSTLDIELL